MGHYASVHREQPGPPQPRPPITIAASSTTLEYPRSVLSNLVMIEEEYSSSEEERSGAMAATRPPTKSKTAPAPVVPQSGIRKSTKNDGTGLNRQRVQKNYESEEDQDKEPQDMDVTTQETSILREPKDHNTTPRERHWFASYHGL